MIIANHGNTEVRGPGVKDSCIGDSIKADHGLDYGLEYGLNFRLIYKLLTMVASLISQSCNHVVYSCVWIKSIYKLAVSRNCCPYARVNILVNHLQTSLFCPVAPPPPPSVHQFALSMPRFPLHAPGPIMAYGEEGLHGDKSQCQPLSLASMGEML